MKENGTLFLIPSPLGIDSLAAIPEMNFDILRQLQFLIAEKAKTTRRFLKSTLTTRTIDSYHISELNEHTPKERIPGLLAPALDGHDIGLLSEAGCPGVADPGAELVAYAHSVNVNVIPLVGPSSILLALMGSGMNGQSFCFNGYLSPKSVDLAKDLKRLEALSDKHNQTQIFIETPYRNGNVLEQVFKMLYSDTLFCIALDLTLPSQFIKTRTIAEWKKSLLPMVNKRLAVFLIYRKH